MTERKDIASDAELEKALDAHFRRNADEVGPSDALMSRILSDADAMQPAQRAFSPKAKTPWWKSLYIEIGGWPSLAGASTAALLGVWIGLGSSSLASDALESFNLASTTQDTEILDPFSGLDFSFIEG